MRLQDTADGSTIHNDFITMNEASGGGGAIAFLYGGKLDITNTVFKQNKVTDIESGSTGGGGIYLQFNVILSIRECSFIKNEAGRNGHQIFTYERDSFGGGPSYSIANTNFTNIVENTLNFYGYDYDTSQPKWGAEKFILPRGCVTNPCIGFPFNGTCTTRTDAKLGVLCGLTACQTGEFRNAQEVTESLLPPLNPPSCSAWTPCTAGEYVSLNGTDTTDRVCVPCGAETYSGVANGDLCTPWTNCSSGQYISTNGTSSSDRVCSNCGLGKFSASTNAYSCADWRNCVAGQKIASNGTATSDRICEACPTGTFSIATNQNACTNWTTCNATTEVESGAGSTTADRVCAAAGSPTPAGAPSPSGYSPSPAGSPTPAGAPSPSGNSPSPVESSPSPADSPSPAVAPSPDNATSSTVAPTPSDNATSSTEVPSPSDNATSSTDAPSPSDSPTTTAAPNSTTVLSSLKDKIDELSISSCNQPVWFTTMFLIAWSVLQW
jgi:hypothetical protein